MTVKSVAVIGAGPSGIISLDALVQEQVFDNIRVFERRDQAGGCWIYNEEPPEALPKLELLSQRKVAETLKKDLPDLEKLPLYVPKSSTQRFLDTATYSYLESNVEKETMEFTQEPFPEDKTELSIDKYGKDTPFRHNTKIKNWIQDIYKKKGYHDLIEFNTSVELVQKNGDKWDIVLRRFGKKRDYIWKESFDAVVVASGRYDVPFIPHVEGLQQFKDTPGKVVIHSKGYRSKEHFRNKKTIVVGGSISAGDALQDIIDVAKTPVISSIRKSTQPHPYFGFYAFDHHKAEKHTELIKIENNTAFFDDGTSVPDVDAIIFGTGFALNFPFLPNLKKSQFIVKDVYQHIFNIEDPTLAFVGNINAGLTFKAFEWQAVFVARFLAGRTKLPSKSEQYEWVTNRLKQRGDSPKYSSVYPQFKQYFNTIRQLAGNEGPGRKLPEFNDYWEKAFYRGHQRRIKYWIEHNNRAKL